MWLEPQKSWNCDAVLFWTTIGWKWQAEIVKDVTEHFNVYLKFHKIPSTQFSTDSFKDLISHHIAAAKVHTI